MQSIRKLHLIMALACMCGLSACAKEPRSHFHALEQGMRSTELVSLMGIPRVKKWNGTSEAWQYCEEGFFVLPKHYTVVWIKEDAIMDVRRYDNFSNGDCDEFSSTFNWAQEPEGGFRIEKHTRQEAYK